MTRPRTRCTPSPRGSGERVARALSAFTRVHSPSKTGVNALKDALWRGEGRVRGSRAPRNIPVTRGLDPRVHPLRRNFLRRRWIASQLGLARVAHRYAPQVG